MGLNAELPFWMGKTVVYTQPGIMSFISIIQRLEKEVIKLKIFKICGVVFLLRVDQFKLMAFFNYDVGSCLRTYTYPINPLR